MKYCIIGMLLTAVFTAWAQPPDTLWTRSYSGSGNSPSLAATPDGGFLITLEAGWPYDAGLLKIDSAGDVQWQRAYGVPETFEVFMDATPCPAGGYVAVGQRYGYPTYYRPEIYVVRTDDQGDTLWTRTRDVQDDDILNAVAIAANGDIVCAGSAGYIGPNTDAGDVLVVRYTDAGELVWLGRYRTGLTCGAFDIIPFSDDRFLVGGSSGYMWEDDHSWAYLLMLEGSGDTVWTRTYTSLTFTDCRTVAATEDGGFAFAGLAKSDPNDSSDLLILRADSLGHPLWSGRYGSGYARSINQVPDGGFAVFYGSIRYPGVGSQFGIKRLTASGDTLWTGLYGTTSDNYLASGLALPDQSYLMMGLIPGIYLVRTRPEGQSASEPPPFILPPSSVFLSASPNPFNATTTVTYGLPQWAFTQLTVYDILGRQVQGFAPAWLPPGNHQLRLACEGWSSGLYVLRLESGKEAATIKLLLEK